MNWQDELRRLVELYRTELGEIVAAFLLSIPFKAHPPLAKLARIGRNWGNVDYQFNELTPHPLTDYPDALRTIFENPHGARAGEDWVEVTLNRHTSRFISSLWLLAYVAILAWHQEHEPEYTEPELPADPNECLAVLCDQISTTNECFDPSPILERLSTLGVPETMTRKIEGLGLFSTTPSALLRTAETNLTARLDEEHAFCFIDSAGFHNYVELPEPLAQVASAFLSRRKRLAFPWPPH